MAAPVVVVMSTSGTVSVVAALDCVCEEDTSVVNSLIVEAPPATTAPIAESGSGAESLPSWVEHAAESWGPRPLVAPRPLEPWDVGDAFMFVPLECTSKDHKAWVKSEKKK
jgi:hypothetical protein